MDPEFRTTPGNKATVVPCDANLTQDCMHLPASNRHFAGVEGGLVELVELVEPGFKPKFVIHHKISDTDGTNPMDADEKPVIDKYPYYTGIIAAQDDPKRVIAWGFNVGHGGGTVQLSSDGGSSFRSVTAATLLNPLDVSIVGAYFDRKNNRFLVVTRRHDNAFSAGAIEIFAVSEQ